MNTNHIESLLSSLRKAIDDKDSKRILKLYEMLEGIDWDKQPDWLFDSYDDLVDKANEIIM